MIDNRPPPVLPCTGWCRGDRGALDAPSKAVRTPSGKVHVLCKCCGRELRPATAAEQPVRPANLRDEVTADHVMFVDDACGYDTVLLANIRAL